MVIQELFLDQLEHIVGIGGGVLGLLLQDQQLLLHPKLLKNLVHHISLSDTHLDIHKVKLSKQEKMKHLGPTVGRSQLKKILRAFFPHPQSWLPSSSDL